MYLDRWTKQKISNRKKRFARKCRRRTRPERRRIAKTSQNVPRARSQTGELNIATWNVRSLSLTGRRGAGHAEVLLQKCKVLGCDVLPCVFMRLALVCFYCLCVFVYVLYFIATMSFAGYFLPVLFCMLSMLISDSRLIWFGSVYLVTTAGFVADQLM